MTRRAVGISTDASYRDGVAGIAAVVEGAGVPRVLFVDVVFVSTAAEGERVAVEKAMGIARRAGWNRAVFRTDARGLRPRGERLPGWRVRWVPRRRNVQAHVVAGEARRIWEAGRVGQPTHFPASDLRCRGKESPAPGRADEALLTPEERLLAEVLYPGVTGWMRGASLADVDFRLPEGS